MGELEAAADIATGALIGRAVGGHGHAPDGGGVLCLNCGTALVGEHCHACGQAGHVHRTVGAIGHELAHGVFHFEGKIWRTLPLLVFRPGELTRRYVAGERTRFVSPLAIFLFSVFLMFAIVANLPGWHFGNSKMMQPKLANGLVEAREKLADERRAADESIADLTKKLADARADPETDARRIARLEQRLATARKASSDLARAQQFLPAPGKSDDDIRVTSHVKGSEEWLEAKLNHARENPQLVLYKMKSSAYKFSWALIPLSVPFLWLLFPFSRRFGLYDHAVFATYSLTFMSLLVITLAVLGAIGVPSALLGAGGLLGALIHIYKQMKNAYGLRRISALVRTTLLVAIIVCIIVPIFSLGLVYVGVAD